MSYDSVCEACEMRFEQMFCSVLSAQKQYLHSDGTFFGHSLVHPNEGHIVVKVINRTLKRKQDRQGQVKNHEALHD